MILWTNVLFLVVKEEFKKQAENTFHSMKLYQKCSLVLGKLLTSNCGRHLELQIDINRTEVLQIIL